MNKKLINIAMIGLLAALSYLAFTFLQFKIPTPGGTTSFHLGNTFCVLAALLIGGVPGGVAGAIGMGIGDLMDPVYFTSAPKTIVLKFIIGVVTGIIAHRLLHIRQKQKKTMFIDALIASAGGMFCNILLEPIWGYIYSRFFLGASSSAASMFTNWNIITTTTNAILTVIIASCLYTAIYPKIAPILNKNQ